MKVLARPSLAKRCTLGTGGFGLAEIRLEKRRDYDELPAILTKEGASPLALGGGSNMLFGEGELPLLLVSPRNGAARPALVRPARPARAAGGEGASKDEGRAIVEAQAALPLPLLLRWCAEQGLSGLEGLVGLPGRLGGAVAMNAGAYGDDMASCLAGLELWSAERGFLRLETGQWTASYRSFVPGGVPGWSLIVSARLALRQSSPERVRETMRANLERKRASQPLEARSAGCVFKNPPGEHAGRLLDQAGMRGKGQGGMWFTDKHANFLANRGGGRAPEALELIEEARSAVARRFGINLELELRIWPCTQAR